MNLCKLNHPLSTISICRTELMGWAILFVMLSHSTSTTWADIPFIHSIAGKGFALNDVGGFLFLSGFGLYYSFAKNNTISTFLKKRVKRLYIPFMMIALPFYVFSVLRGELSYSDAILAESGAYFFVHGNNGMWYISMTLLLYLLFPMFYSLLFKGKNVYVRFLILIICVFTVIEALRYCCPQYYSMTAIGLHKVPLFIVGMLVGYMSQKGIKLNGGGIFC